MKPDSDDISKKGHIIPKKPTLKPEHVEDKRETVREENTAHFTNRAPKKGQ